jgi:hypothetical protein
LGATGQEKKRIKLSDIYQISWKSSPRAKVSRNVTESFRNESQENISKYVDWLYGNISTSTRTIKQSAALITGLMAAFELIQDSTSTADITIFSFAIPKHSVAIQFIPAVVAFLYVQMVQDSIQINRSRVAFSKAFDLWSKSSKSLELSTYILPSSSLYWSPFMDDVRTPPSEDEAIIYRIGVSFEAIFLILLVAFLGQAYFTLFSTHFNENLAAWVISLCFTLFCIRADFALMSYESGLSAVVRSARHHKRKNQEEQHN